MTRTSLPLPTRRARRLRRDMTEAETVLWQQIRAGRLGCRFRRQHPIGRYIVDFVCLRHAIVIECDGSQHLESRYDERRDAYLAARGFTVLRFRNHEILGDLDMVTSTIAGHAKG